MAQTGVRTGQFQYGLNSYTNVRDTYVSSLDWDTPPQYSNNYGRNQYIVLSRNDDENPLLRFDLTDIPSNSAVSSATLSLYNFTDSSSGSNHYLRRIRAFDVWKDWDEGNQTNSPIDQPGDHGANGDYAALFYSGEGSNTRWGAQALEAGVDYNGTEVTYTDVADPGWYVWDITALATEWIRGGSPNRGLLLRDATGYQDSNRDDRTFASSQYGTQNLRPLLQVVYNPDVPFVDAGSDQTNYSWQGTSISLDGSNSHDRPGGDDSSLVYTWRIIQPAYGSDYSGTLSEGTNPVCFFTPDAAGTWEFELVASNSIGEVSTDRVVYRLYSISAAHPRIYLSPSAKTALQARANNGNSYWQAVLQQAADGDICANALVWQMTGTNSFGYTAIADTVSMIENGEVYGGSTPGDIALVFDWCYDLLTTPQRTNIIHYLNGWGHTNRYGSPEGFSDGTPGWGNYWPRYGYSFVNIGLATYGDNAMATEWMNEYRQTRYEDFDLKNLDRIAAGGGWPEGMIYDWIANRPRMMALESWTTGAGENLFLSTEWFRERLGYILLHRWPGLAEEWGYYYHPYLSTGDTERNRGAMGDYERIMALILASRFTEDPKAAELLAYLSAPPADHCNDFVAEEEFLWFNPEQTQQAPETVTHIAADLGTVFMRSGWPSGAADTNTDVTYISFQCGDHYAYHQHFDQNSFTLFRHDDLAIDSGVYSGEGLYNHDINYYVRTIAHNTLVVYNPDETFAAARPDATSNDGGQRDTSPASRAPQTVEYVEQYSNQYERGDIERFEDHRAYTYALGDATAAYNNPHYWQLLDEPTYTGNVPKVSRFERELVYLRPVSATRSALREDVLVLCDRVGVTKAEFSGENTKLLFHVLGEPVVDGISTTVVSTGETLYSQPDFAVADRNHARLFVKPLFPTNNNLRKVGGRGEKSFWVFDDNYDWQISSGEAQPRPTNDFEDEPYGEWRLELEPADTNLNHIFLTVLYPTTTNTSALPEINRITNNQMIGAHIKGQVSDWVVLFSAAQDGAAPTGTISWSYTATNITRNLLFDLPPSSNYTASIERLSGTVTVTLTPSPHGECHVSSQGVLFLYDDTNSVDQDGDDLPDMWELDNELNPRDATGVDGREGDPDGDGVINYSEAVAGTDPWNAESLLQLTSSAFSPQTNGIVIRWPSASNRNYALSGSTNLAESIFTPIATNLPATWPTNEYIDSLTNSAPLMIYRIEVEQE